ncbi:unnamed protein product [Allacma fusca]|uniref:Uncharacterized protein n=1 Tax=Allacma fusca TaxID=39272 RepID=A0A8J2P2I7_9HEXA|nr:unnamed protein product [Allacma fusca]
MVCRQDLNESTIQLEFVNDQDTEVAEKREVETDEEVVVLGGHVGGVPIVNRGQVARRGRRRPGHGGMAVTSTVTSSDVADAVGWVEDRAGDVADVAEAVGGAEDRAGEGADVVEPVGGAEDGEGEGADDMAEAVGGAEDGAGEGAEAAVFVGAGLDVVEVEGADVGAAAVLGAEVEGFEAAG